MKPKRRTFLKIFLITLAALFMAAFLGLAYAASLTKNLPNPQEMTSRPDIESTKIYDRTGQTLISEVHGEEKRTIISFEDIPEVVREATIAIEDQGFYLHPGFDWRGIIRAFITDIARGTLSQGASTITQQLAKWTFLTPEKTFSRKIKELILAYWIEKKYDKDEILTMYLNKIPYGSNAYGIEAAAKTFFNKPAKELGIAEAAALAALPQAPSYYSPWGSHQKELERRKNYVLEQMMKLGFIDEEEKNSAQNETLDFVKPDNQMTIAPHFLVMVKEYLAAKYGEDAVEQGGLKVITTIDLNLQKEAEIAVEEGALRNKELYKGYNAALVAEDPKTGQILAMVGSRNYNDDPEPEGCIPEDDCLFVGNFNVATQGLRQPGSTFKPFAYITAFKKGYSPETLVFDLPTEFSVNPVCPAININYFSVNPACFHPQNFDHQFIGPVNLRNSLAQSRNIPSVKVLYLAGLEDTIQTAESFGISTLKDRSRFGLSLVLGGGEIKLNELVHAYSVFATEGRKHEQTFILEVKDNKNKILEEFKDKSEEVIESEYARWINSILSDVQARSVLLSSSLNMTVFPGYEVALKTGTTNDYKDAWAMGYTPSLVVGVWAGNNSSEPMQQQGGSILAAVPIWSAFLNKVINTLPQETFTPPSSYALPDKPMLNGNHISPDGIHDILYYIDKNNPLGPKPENPGDDPQFMNWELPVQNWLNNNQ